MKIGIIAAMRKEIDAVRGAMESPTVETVSGIEFVSGRFMGCDAVIAQSGVGKVFAAVCTQTMILKYAPDVIINSGIAGTLSDKLGIGDVAVSLDVVQHDMDTSAVGDPVGMVSGVNMIHFPASKTLAEKIIAAANKLGMKAVPGTIASGDQFVASKERKEEITERFGAIACEMEGAAIGHVCYINGVPFSVIRAISDNADDSSGMDYDAFQRLALKMMFAVLSETASDLAASPTVK